MLFRPLGGAFFALARGDRERGVSTSRRCAASARISVMTLKEQLKGVPQLVRTVPPCASCASRARHSLQDARPVRRASAPEQTYPRRTYTRTGSENCSWGRGATSIPAGSTPTSSTQAGTRDRLPRRAQTVPLSGRLRRLRVFGAHDRAPALPGGLALPAGVPPRPEARGSRPIRNSVPHAPREAVQRGLDDLQRPLHPLGNRLVRRHADGYQPGFVVNDFFRSWGHEFIYDKQTLRHALAAVGLVDIEEWPIGESREPQLAGLERHLPDEAEFDEYETLVGRLGGRGARQSAACCPATHPARSARPPAS